MASSSNFYSYTDANGVQVIVQGLADVPEQYRAQVKHINLSNPAIKMPVDTGEGGPTVPAVGADGGGEGALFHGPSFFLGVATTLVLGAAALLAFRRKSRLVGLILGVVVMATLSLGYLTYVRRQAGLPGSGLATPGTILDDARAAAGAVNERHRAQERILDEIDKQR